MSQHGLQLPHGEETPEQPGSENAKLWLLFAGSEPEVTTDVPVAIFRNEAQARRAFVNERLRSGAPGAWAQLTAVDCAGRTRVACWFGSQPNLDGNRTPGDGSSECRPLHERPKGREWTRVVGAAVVIAIAALIVGLWLIAHNNPARSAGTGSTARAPLPEATAGVPVGYRLTGATSERYAPGESRQWFPTDGPHQVIVLVGKLSVEDSAGHRVDYGARASYVAGWAPYTVSNHTAEPVTVTVRFLRPATGREAASLGGTTDGYGGQRRTSQRKGR